MSSIANGQGRELLFASVSAASSGNNTVVAAVSGYKIKVVSYVLVAGGAVSAKWKAASTDKTGAMPFAANGGAAVLGQPSAHLLETAAGEALVLNLSSAVQVSGHVSYFLEA